MLLIFDFGRQIARFYNFSLILLIWCRSKPFSIRSWTWRQLCFSQVNYFIWKCLSFRNWLVLNRRIRLLCLQKISCLRQILSTFLLSQSICMNQIAEVHGGRLVVLVLRYCLKRFSFGQITSNYFLTVIILLDHFCINGWSIIVEI